MGSDVSYEDALESDKLREKYTVTLEGEKQVGNRTCYHIVLDAKATDVPYFKRTMLVDREYFIVWKEQMFARSGKLLKESNTLDIKKIGGRWFPTRVEMVNKLRKDTKTVFEMSDLKFDERMDESMFTMRYLRR
jgi:outer membrane lipoprotein-sorting protein